MLSAMPRRSSSRPTPPDVRPRGLLFQTTRDFTNPPEPIVPTEEVSATLDNEAKPSLWPRFQASSTVGCRLPRFSRDHPQPVDRVGRLFGGRQGQASPVRAFVREGQGPPGGGPSR